MGNQAAIPALFCWTRFGSEAGQSPARILQRKEAERRANGGLFLWGIGNSLAGAIEALVERCSTPEVLFSPIAGPPRVEDVLPAAVVEWTEAVTLWGEPFSLPTHSVVTSRLGLPPKTSHYALVCFSPTPIALYQGVPLARSSLLNLRSGRPVGASQVSAVVRHDEHAPVLGRRYAVAFRARLAFPYFLRLKVPVPTEHEGPGLIEVLGRRAEVAIRVPVGDHEQSSVS
jgi:hypothetical protein